MGPLKTLRIHLKVGLLRQGNQTSREYLILLILLFYALPVRTRVCRNFFPGFWSRVYKVYPDTVLSKGKSVPIQARGVQRNLRFPDYVTTAQDGGKVVSLTHRPHYTPRKYTWYSFLLEAESTPGP